jgi:hypothetical protein
VWDRRGNFDRFSIAVPFPLITDRVIQCPKERKAKEKEEEREKQRPSNLRLGLPPRPPPIDETNLAKSPPRLPIKFIPQQAKHAHLRPRRDSPAPLHRPLLQYLRLLPSPRLPPRLPLTHHRAAHGPHLWRRLPLRARPRLPPDEQRAGLHLHAAREPRVTLPGDREFTPSETRACDGTENAVGSA